MKIRKATKKDINGIFHVFLEMVKSEDKSAKKVGTYNVKLRQKRKDFRISAKKELLREIYEENGVFLVAEENNNILGYVRGNVTTKKDPFFKPSTIGYLNAIAVLKKFRGRGFASKLYYQIEEWFKKHNCSQIHLEVFEYNPSIKMYEKWGYKKLIYKMSKKL